MEAGHIPNDQISASTFYDNDHRPEHGRLGNASFWLPAGDDTRPWFQVSFGSSMIITVIALEVINVGNDVMEAVFELEYAFDKDYWVTYRNLAENGHSVSVNEYSC